MVLCTRENCIRAEVPRLSMEPPAREIAAAEAREIELYETYGSDDGYGFYMARRVG
jgi:hypothetical protein